MRGNRQLSIPESSTPKRTTIHAAQYFYQQRAVDRLQQRKSKSSTKKNLRKIVTLLSFCLSVTLCTWQVGNCFSKYFQFPLGTEVTFEKINQIVMPTIYFCPLKPVDEMDEIFNMICAKNNNRKSEKYSATHFKKLGTSIYDIWMTNSVLNISSRIKCPDISTKEDCKKGFITNRFIDTIDGRCHMLTLEGIQFNNTAKLDELWIIKLTNEMKLQLSDPVQIILQKEKVMDRYLIDMPFVEFQRGQLIKWNIDSVTEYHRASCLTRKEYVECMNDCFDALLLNKIPHNYCRLPYLKNHDKYECRNMQDVSKSNEWVQSFNFDPPNCNCKWECETTKYNTRSIILNNLERNISSSTLILRVYFTAKFKQRIKEYYVYTITSLLSDLAGNFGFFLGISLMNVLEFLKSKLLSD